MQIKTYIYILLVPLFILTGCSESIQITKKSDQLPSIFPDYIDVTIPPNIAPLNFKLLEKYENSRLYLEVDNEKIEIKGKRESFDIPESKWNSLLEKAKGKDIQVTVCVKNGEEWMSYVPFSWHVADEPIDPYIAYRLIPPGYTLWSEMGIYQRNLETFKETAIIENKMTENNCMNCHSFCMQDPDKMLFHMRQTYPGTYLINGDKIEKLNTKTDQTISALVYPSWHPSGRYIAFTVNDTKQAFHMNDPNRVEVFDLASDVLVYDVEKHELVTTPELFSKNHYETFPTFSPDGRTLYFCTANMQNMPTDFKEVKYSLCSVSFDPDKRTFGTTVDTLFNALSEDKSVSFPRVSPDGKYLLYTLSSYGNFSIWHKDADLHMINLETGEKYPLKDANSTDVESYHSWCSNSRWIVFSSRRIDGLYTRPYFAYIDEKGQAKKAVLLPQKDTGFYHRFMKSYNIPEFIKGEVNYPIHSIVDIAKNEKGIDVKFSGGNQYPTATPVESMAH